MAQGSLLLRPKKELGMKVIFGAILTALFLFSGAFPAGAFSQNPSLQQAIEQYKQENYEEAIAILTEAFLQADHGFC
jgi:hypothetical protein